MQGRNLTRKTGGSKVQNSVLIVQIFNSGDSQVLLAGHNGLLFLTHLLQYNYPIVERICSSKVTAKGSSKRVQRQIRSTGEPVGHAQVKMSQTSGWRAHLNSLLHFHGLSQ